MIIHILVIGSKLQCLEEDMRAAYTDHCATSTSSPTALSRSSSEHHEVRDPSRLPLQFGDSLRQEESFQ